ncbi:hypothetical protein ACJJH9_01525 [Microbulbifer sp. DLAB2-AF]|uniref:hypothetical protein n=1 Tax=Microbulbifer sp. DLAB2-AF TaxID=3243395 RepID=UPI004039E053
MKSPKIGKLFFDSFLIVFSVLLALFLNEYRETSKEEKEKERALQMVQIELKNNLKTLNELHFYHKTVLKNYETALEGGDVIMSYNEQRSLINQLMPNGITQKVLDDSAWETIKQSSVSSNLDINKIFALSKLYKIQKLGVNTTLKHISTNLNSQKIFNEPNSRKALFLVKNQFEELVSQEVFLIGIYNKTISEFEEVETAEKVSDT